LTSSLQQHIGEALQQRAEGQLSGRYSQQGSHPILLFPFSYPRALAEKDQQFLGSVLRLFKLTLQPGVVLSQLMCVLAGL
jgi:hypothetical protein